MKALKLALIGGIAATAVAGFASVASAETTVAYNVGVASDYVFRGIDQSAAVYVTPGSPAQTLPVFSNTAPFAQTGTVTIPAVAPTTTLVADNNTEVFGGVDVSSGPLYAGVWLSNTGPSVAEGAELDIYGGYKVPLGGATLDLGVVSYNYSKGTFVSDKANNYELKAALSVPVGGLTLGGVVYWTPDFAVTGKDGTYAEVNGAYTFANKATVSAAYGEQMWNPAPATPSIPDSYATWNVGVTYPLTEKLSLDARYIGADDDAAFVGPAANGKVVGTLKVVF